MHLTDEQLNEYLDDEADDRILIETHIAACMDCAARLSALQALFAEIESLPEVEPPHSIAARFSPSRSLPAALPRSLTLTVILQAALAAATIIIAAPFVLQFISPRLSNLSAPSFTEMFIQVQTQWAMLLDALSTFHLPTLPEIPMLEFSSIFMLLAVVGASLLWLVGNGLLLRNQIK